MKITVGLVVLSAWVLLTGCAPGTAPIARTVEPVEFAALREVSLNGTWRFYPDGQSEAHEIAVPEFWDATPGFMCDQARYEREVTLPDSWAGRIIAVRFDGVNHAAGVYVNDRYAGGHVGGWTPFEEDITELVEPGETFTLRVDVKGSKYPPIVDKRGKCLWPVGAYVDRAWGIIFDVNLLCHGPVHIVDAFVQPSYRNKTLTCRVHSSQRHRHPPDRATGGGELEVILTAGKQDVLKFREVRRFKVVGEETAEATSRTVTFGTARSADSE